MSIQSDPVHSAVYNGIKRGIQAALDAECYGSAVVLLYAGLDAMASLGRPRTDEEVTADTFIRWANRYMTLDGDTQVSGDEWYSARCAVLHSYGVESRRTRAGQARRIGYMVGGKPAIRFNPAVSTDFLIVDVPALSDSFFRGIDRFLVDMFADKDLAPIVEERVQKLLSAIPYSVAWEE